VSTAVDVVIPAATAPVWSGLLAIDKPAGVTSHDVVDKARRRLKARGAGHLGTLDPGASGLLLLALGSATRCITVWQGGEKTYEGVVRFGVTTSSQDLHGEILAERPTDGLDEARVRAAARALTGTFDQIPPMVSALHVGGERLYRLARRGETVERAPRRVTVAAWDWLSFALPEATFRVRVSGGTYVRTLAHDLGEALGCGGALRTLRRVRSEPFGIERAVPFADLDRLPAAEVLARGVPLDEALAVLPAVTLDAEAVDRIGHGAQPLVPLASAPGATLGAGPRSIVLRDGGGRALGLGELLAAPGESDRAQVCPHALFPWAVRIGR
jgi:tRNA pseudouridine55 synthase